MLVGNLIALRQTNIVRMLAYSGVAQAGFMMAPLAVAGHDIDVGSDAVRSMVIYFLIYAAMNLGAFGVVLAVARKTRSAEIASYGGLFQYAPGLTVAMSFFLFALAGIPPLGGWFAKFVIFRAAISPATFWGYALGVVIAVNSVIALVYYANVAKQMWFNPVPDDVDATPVRVPPAISAALVITVVLTVLFGVLPGIVSDLTEFEGFLVAGS